MVQPNFTLEIEVLYTLFDRWKLKYSIRCLIDVNEIYQTSYGLSWVQSCHPLQTQSCVKIFLFPFKRIGSVQWVNRMWGRLSRFEFVTLTIKKIEHHEAMHDGARRNGIRHSPLSLLWIVTEQSKSWEESGAVHPRSPYVSLNIVNTSKSSRRLFQCFIQRKSLEGAFSSSFRSPS